MIASMQMIHGPPHIQVGAGSHVGKVEERIRRIKDTYRSLQASRPFKFGDNLAVWAIKFANYVLNLIPPRIGDGRSPREILTGVRILRPSTGAEQKGQE